MQIIFTDGLGNQMFQYALYLALRHRGRNSKINTGIITRNIIHNGFELCDVFNIEREKLSFAWTGSFVGGVTIFIYRYLGKLLCYKQNIDEFSDEVFSTRKPFLTGFWQDVRYFNEVQQEVREAFGFRGLDAENLQIAKDMQSCESVSLHIRRGDYLKNANYQVCTPEYYKGAIDRIKGQVDTPLFYIFSDDLQWSEDFVKSLGIRYKLVGLNRGKNSYKDMYLMTQCHHNIIANSSFSWWGAWLGNQPAKIVVCPNIWLHGHKMDPCPEVWTRIII